MPDNERLVYFNNCRSRDHVRLYGSGAFYDLSTTGSHATKATDLRLGQQCVVATTAPGNRVAFNWYYFRRERIQRANGRPFRVFFGKFFTSETFSKADAARKRRYSAFFDVNGNFKRQSVISGVVPQNERPVARQGNASAQNKKSKGSQGGAGFGDPIDNKLVETAAIDAVRKAYENDRWRVRSVERDKCGFDLECHKGRLIKNVEVKGVSAATQCFIITAAEVERARKDKKFVLMVVTSALSASPILTPYSGREFSQQFDLSAIQYRAALRS